MDVWDTRVFRALPRRFSQVDAPLVVDRDQQRAFFDVLNRVIDGSRLVEEADCLQHGTTTILLHSIAVAHVACRWAHRLGWCDHLFELERAALLHDYFLYNWHEPGVGHEMHAFMHATRAMRNAQLAFPDLTLREADAIRSHMFPLTPVPPHYREGWLVTYADKWCATYETAQRRAPAYPRLRELCACYLPGVRLDVETVPRGGSGVRVVEVIGATSSGVGSGC